MTEVLHLRVRSHGLDEAKRLRADLAAAYARGTELGPRTPYIQAHGERLLELSRALERALEELDLLLNELGIQDPDPVEALRGIVGAAEGLPITAQRVRPAV